APARDRLRDRVDPVHRSDARRDPRARPRVRLGPARGRARGRVLPRPGPAVRARRPRDRSVRTCPGAPAPPPAHRPAPPRRPGPAVRARRLRDRSFRTCPRVPAPPPPHRHAPRRGAPRPARPRARHGRVGLLGPVAPGPAHGRRTLRPGGVMSDVKTPEIGAAGWARWAWRQLTSMRVALLLLLALAVAAVPGSIFPQQPQDPVAVAEYVRDNPTLAAWLERLGFFDVYASP